LKNEEQKTLFKLEIYLSFYFDVLLFF